MSFHTAMSLKLSTKVREAVYAEASRQGISPPRLIAKLLEAQLITSLNGEPNVQNENGSKEINRQ